MHDFRKALEDFNRCEQGTLDDISRHTMRAIRVALEQAMMCPVMESETRPTSSAEDVSPVEDVAIGDDAIVSDSFSGGVKCQEKYESEQDACSCECLGGRCQIHNNFGVMQPAKYEDAQGAME